MHITVHLVAFYGGQMKKVPSNEIEENAERYASLLALLVHVILATP